MYGSFLYNCWAALLGFAVYFALMMQVEFVVPVQVLIGSLVAALIGFLLTYAIRYFLGYVLYTPEIVMLQEGVDEQVANEKQPLELPALDQATTVEFADESTEEIAQVVRTMMHQEQQSVPNA